MSTRAPDLRPRAPAEEWLLDNAHTVEEQTRQVEDGLPKGYLRELPRLATGPMAGHPRVYALCLDYLRHTDARVDPESLVTYVKGYQAARHLTIGELWAAPLMLRVGLLLIVLGVAESVLDESESALAPEWADALIGNGPARSLSTSGPSRRAVEPKSPAFLVELQRLLRERDATPQAFDWVRERASALGTSPEELGRRLHLKRAADQLAVANAITSMRTIGTYDWSQFFERTSVVEETLRRDPRGAYGDTDAPCRDRYRHAVENIARRSKKDECDVAAAALFLAQRGGQGARGHVGFYLENDGLGELERHCNARLGPKAAVARAILEHPRLFYFSLLGGVTLSLVVGIFAAARALGAGFMVAAGMCAVLFLAASELALSLLGSLVVTILPPRLLSRYSFEHGIPAAHRTMVVVPALLDGPETTKQVLAELEIRALANPDENIHFALITDFCDAGAAERAGEEALLARAVSAIADLNAKHSSPDDRPRFALFHRKRLFNAAEGCFMGWERKRGKLEELNRLLRGDGNTTFTVITAPKSLLATIRYVITLDADTELPRAAAVKLVGTIAHPLNRPVLDAARKRVVAGYGVIQPRVGTAPASSRRSSYARISAGAAGIDPYTTAVSDVYQDLFGEGSYTGKAIYDVDAFAAALDGRIPEKSILSHDLYEGIFARTALASDVELLDEQPASYGVVARREHRWIRGDWQLLARLGRRVRTASGTRPNDLPLLGYWKVVDNMRRSLLAPSLVLAFVAACLVGPRLALFLAAFELLVLMAPLSVRFFASALRAAREPSGASFEGVWSDARTSLLQVALAAILLFDQAVIAIDAVCRTMFRLWISRRHLLEWQSTRLDRHGGLTPKRMWVESALALGGLLAMVLERRDAAVVAPPFLLWAFAPVIIGRLSRRDAPPDPANSLSADDRRSLRLVARRTWRFFDRFVTDEDHWLPPDNFQEEPRGTVAHRTSPTNIGLYLLSVLAARDFGYLTTRASSKRIHDTLDTLDRLEHHEGHILNWYDTKTLKPLEPRYVSTVDSGNLAACCWVVRQACDEWLEEDLVGTQAFDAARDTLVLCGAKYAPVYPPSANLVDVVSSLVRLKRELESAHDVEAKAEAAQEVKRWIDEIEALAPHLSWLSEGPPAIRRELENVTRSLLGARSISAIAREAPIAREHVEVAAQGTADPASRAWMAELSVRLKRAAVACNDLIVSVKHAGARARKIGDDMRFGFLFDARQALFSIGYNLGTARLDGSRYDLLASEARVASLLAIAKGDVPDKHWFRLGRTRCRAGSGRALLSWSGSMFEYLMPLLVTRNFADTLLGETCSAAVDAHLAYGKRRGVPWGISEAAFNVMDLALNYQYRAFGVQALGLKSGLDDDLVIAPYATLLAAMLRPNAALANLAALRHAGLEGEYGFYESIDFTASRVPPGRRGIVVKTYMAHHQGMSLVALCNTLLGAPMQRRFHADARIKATELLLEERIPTHATLAEAPAARTHAEARGPADLSAVETVGLGRQGILRAHLLGHGELATVVTSAGTGMVTWRGMDVARYREDAWLNPSGIFLYVHNRTLGTIWSSGFEPVRAQPKSLRASFAVDRVELHRTDGDIETTTEIAVSPEHPAEVRRLTFANRGHSACEIELTTYMEVVLAPRAADLSHRAFSNMFVQTEALTEPEALLATRRPKSSDEMQPWLAQLLTPESGGWTPLEYEVSREAFVGRGRDVAMPRGVRGALSNRVGYPLDPILALRRRVVIEAGGTARVALVTALAASRSEVVALAQRYVGSAQLDRTFELAWADARVELQHLGIEAAQSFRFQRLLSFLLAPQRSLRAQANPDDVRGDQRAAVWAQGISGDLPLLIVRIDDGEVGTLCREVLLAHEFFRLNNVSIDLLLFNEEPAGYFQPAQDQALALLRASPSQAYDNQRGGVFIRRACHLDPRERALVLAAGRVVLRTSEGSLARQLRHAADLSGAPSLVKGSPVVMRKPNPPPLRFDNGVGGFSQSGREYFVYGETPAPWCNVLANPTFGTVVSETGGGFSWFGNSQRQRLTPWSNDSVGDPPGELIYVRDDQTGSVWRPLGLACHGHGYTTFEGMANGIRHTVEIGVAQADAAKITTVRLRNESGTASRRLSVYGHVDWVLGVNRDVTRITTLTERDGSLETIFARNPGATGDRTAFFRSTAPVTSWTADRTEFFGSWGSRLRPRGLDRPALSGAIGSGLDPCAALQVEIALAPGEQREISFVLGAAEGQDGARALSAKYASHERSVAALAESRAQWTSILGVVQVETPDPSIDLLINGWLLHQVLACRVWGRSAFYQSGGAYGFRDQLQDVLALVVARPDIAREHILRAASRQFEEGDVQHWWHAEDGQGIRTRCSDDMLWLPFAALEYVRVTQDRTIWDEEVAFLKDRVLAENQRDNFGIPRISSERASLYEHCARAVSIGLTEGAHGLPLMGAGDWNDGMDRVGSGGRGESVWLGWFLANILADFGKVAASRRDTERVQLCSRGLGRLRAALEAHGWDGAWYRRGYFDDGTPLGSAVNLECRIDAIAQSWAVISRAGDTKRARIAISNAEKELVGSDPPMMRLLTPPFDGHGPDPGYVRAYPPGVRENGGQYTHGVLWTVLALAMCGEAERAHALLAKINPIHHGRRPEGVARYAVEPYVVAADVCSAHDHEGRGGWTWYTGAAGWMYRIIVEHLLGLCIEGDRLFIRPCVPSTWQTYVIRYRHGSASYRIEIENARVERGLEVDGVAVALDFVTLVDDGREHAVTVRRGLPARRAASGK